MVTHSLLRDNQRNCREDDDDDDDDDDNNNFDNDHDDDETAGCRYWYGCRHTSR